MTKPNGPKRLRELLAQPGVIRSSILSVEELEQLGYKIVVYPVESLMVCAQAMRNLCQALLTTGRVDEVAAQAVSFAEIKQILGVEQVLGLRERLSK